MTGSKQVVHWTSETWYECSEIAGSPQNCCKQVYEKCLRIAHQHSYSSTVYFMSLGHQRRSGGNCLTNSRGRAYHNCCQSDGREVATLSNDEFWQPPSKYTFFIRCSAIGCDSPKNILLGCGGFLLLMAFHAANQLFQVQIQHLCNPRPLVRRFLFRMALRCELASEGFSGTKYITSSCPKYYFLQRFVTALASCQLLCSIGYTQKVLPKGSEYIQKLLPEGFR
jgi:hypothetical protein